MYLVLYDIWLIRMRLYRGYVRGLASIVIFVSTPCRHIWSASLCSPYISKKHIYKLVLSPLDFNSIFICILLRIFEASDCYIGGPFDWIARYLHRCVRNVAFLGGARCHARSVNRVDSARRPRVGCLHDRVVLGLLILPRIEEGGQWDAAAQARWED